MDVRLYDFVFACPHAHIIQAVVCCAMLSESLSIPDLCDVQRLERQAECGAGLKWSVREKLWLHSVTTGPDL